MYRIVCCESEHTCQNECRECCPRATPGQWAGGLKRCRPWGILRHVLALISVVLAFPEVIFPQYYSWLCLHHPPNRLPTVTS